MLIIFCTEGCVDYGDKITKDLGFLHCFMHKVVSKFNHYNFFGTDSSVILSHKTDVQFKTCLFLPVRRFYCL